MIAAAKWFQISETITSRSTACQGRMLKLPTRTRTPVSSQ